MNLKRITIDALYLSVPLAFVGGAFTFAAQSGLTYTTPEYTLSITTSDTLPPTLPEPGPMPTD